jgi:DNA helicase-2/ATP-dependent DNA helicase PcrA
MNPVIRDEQHLIDVVGIPFTDQQLAAITAELDRPSAIVAGAGSGKTTVMAARVLWLVGHVGVAPEKILGLTFTNKAAAELGLRIRRSLDLLGPSDEERGEVTASTYHAFAGSLIAEHGLRLGIEPDLRIVTDASRFQRVARAIESYPGQLDHAGTHLPTLVGQVVALDAELSEHLVEPGRLRDFDRSVIAQYDPAAKLVAVVRDAALTARTRSDLTRLVDAYRELKAVDGVLDFSDQMAAGARLAQVDEVRASLRERFDVVLLDEYQDTSVAQRDLLLGLFSGLPVTAVGDPAQGVYGWRGAATGNLEEFLADFPAADTSTGRLFALSVTNRCAPAIIEAANMIAADYYATSSVVQPIRSAKPAGGSVDVALHETVQQEIDALVAQIAEAHAGGVPLRQIAILVRVSRENGEIVAALRRAGIPFEIVGLTGLLDQPEIVDVVSLLQVVDDATANAAVLRLLTGPRWNIGARDLALLGHRADQLRRSYRGSRDEADLTLEAELARAVEGTDPTEIVSLVDALEDLGDRPYSAEARRRFGELADVVRGLRRHASEPLIELARRAVRALDLDIELEAGLVAGGSDNIAVFLDAVAAYAETDRYASLSGLVAYLAAEDDFNDGMEVATPSEAESVKLLTIHRAKGLEWHTVFVPLVSRTVFPSTRGRGNWIKSVSTLPGPLRGDAASLPQLAEWTPAGSRAFEAENRAEAAMEERRLAYVAFTRAEERLVVSGHWWGRSQQNPRGPSEYLVATRDWLAGRGVEPIAWADPPESGATNPHLIDKAGIDWPVEPPSLAGRQQLANRVREHLGRAPTPVVALPSPADAEVSARLAEISADLELLLAEADAASAAEQFVPLPPTLSTTSVLGLAGNADEFARELARPMPRQPSTAARLGTRFHAWVEAHYNQQVLLDPTDLPGRGDVDLASDADLDAVIELFRTGPYGDRSPAAIEAPFSLVLAGQQIIGRIDAVFRSIDPEGRERWEVVDWKTNRAATADPLQLAVYRLAWAEMNGLDPADVGGAFYYVRLGKIERFDDLPGREALERLVAGESLGS